MRWCSGDSVGCGRTPTMAGVEQHYDTAPGTGFESAGKTARSAFRARRAIRSRGRSRRALAATLGGAHPTSSAPMQAHHLLPIPFLAALGLAIQPKGSLPPASAAAPALPSSHREAPFVTEHPKVDATDFYLFRSYEPGREDTVMVIANYIPLEAPYGGPNYFFTGAEALYEIPTDNDGDALEDLTFQFRFQNEFQGATLEIGPEGDKKTVPVPLLAVGPVDADQDPDSNLRETYTLT